MPRPLSKHIHSLGIYGMLGEKKTTQNLSSFSLMHYTFEGSYHLMAIIDRSKISVDLGVQEMRSTLTHATVKHTTDDEFIHRRQRLLVLQAHRNTYVLKKAENGCFFLPGTPQVGASTYLVPSKGSRDVYSNRWTEDWQPPTHRRTNAAPWHFSSRNSEENSPINHLSQQGSV